MLQKKYSKEKAKVTFSLAAEVQGEIVYLVGDFNQWNETATPMERQADGGFAVTISLAKGQEYQFRYLIDRTEWHNDWQADRYVPNPFSGDNSVIVT
jgi:1,4-alpha-glucan branching enzyme